MRFEEGAPASSSSAAPKPEDRGTSFEAGQKAGETPIQQYDGATLVVVAYVLLWAILMGWIAMVWNKQRGLHRRLDDLEAAIDQSAHKQVAATPAKETR